MFAHVALNHYNHTQLVIMTQELLEHFNTYFTLHQQRLVSMSA